MIFEHCGWAKMNTWGCSRSVFGGFGGHGASRKRIKESGEISAPLRSRLSNAVASRGNRSFNPGESGDSGAS